MIKKIFCWLGFHGTSQYLGAYSEIVQQLDGKHRIKFYEYRCTRCKTNYRVIINKTKL